MSHGFVTKATFKDGRITFSVGVFDFQAKEPVEISGYATQTGGAFANIYEIAQVPDTTDRSVDVTVEPRSVKQFSKDQDVTVVIRVAKVWVTVLGPNRPSVGTPPSPSPADDGITWDKVRVVSQMNGDSGSSGNWKLESRFRPAGRIPSHPQRLGHRPEVLHRSWARGDPALFITRGDSTATFVTRNPGHAQSRDL